MSKGHNDTDEVVFDSLESVTHGAVVNGSGVLAQRVLQFLVNFALTQGLTVALFGVYSLGDRILRILGRFSPLGADQSAVRFLPEYSDSARRNRILGIAYLTAGVASGLIAVGLFVSAPRINAITIDQPEFVGVLRLFAVMLPAFTFVRLSAHVFRALELVEKASDAVGGGLLGIDLMEVGGTGSGEYTVHEVNHTVEFKALNDAVEADVPAAVVDWLETRVASDEADEGNERRAGAAAR